MKYKRVKISKERKKYLKKLVERSQETQIPKREWWRQPLSKNYEMKEKAEEIAKKWL